MQKGTPAVVLCLALALSLGGCATKKQMSQGFDRVDQTIRELEESVESNQTRINENEQVIRDQDGRIIELSDETRAAMNRIDSVEELAQGKLLYQVVLNNDAVKFDFDKFELTAEGRMEIDHLVEKLIQENQNVFVEIQGHTDATGSDDYNYQLGLKRAESVRRYLSARGIPLHRMSVISYGESQPIADNSTPEGRRTNRRVVLLVLE